MTTLRADFRQWLPFLLRAVLGGGAAAAASRAFPTLAAGLPALWPLSGVALALMVRWPMAAVPSAVGIGLGSFAALVLVGEPAWLALALAIGNSAAPWVAAQWLVRPTFDSRLSQPRDLQLLLGVGLLGGAMLSSANTAAWLAVAGRVHPVDLPVAWLAAWAGHSLGLMLVGVPLLVGQTADLRHAFRAGHGLGTVGLLLCVGASSAAAFWPVMGAGSSPFAWLMLSAALVCWLSLRNGLGVASLAVLVLAMGLGTATQAGLGPLAWGFGSSRALALWSVMALLCALTLLPHVAHAELIRLEERSQLALVGSDLGVADWDLRTGETYTSPRWRALLADPDGHASATLDRLLAKAHPDDRAQLEGALAPMNAPPGAGVRHEVRLQVHDSWCWFDLHLNVCERDASGSALRVVASLADTGARRSAQDRQQLSSNLFMHLHEGLLITDDQMRVLDANPTYSRITGVPREELLGTVPGLLRVGGAPDFQGRVQHAAMWADLHTSGHWVGEVVERRRNGDPCALHVTVSSVNGPDGALRYHVLVVSDITEQRLQRERIARQAHFDELTRLPNRAHLSELLKEAMQAAEADGHLLAVCYLDLDHFKDVNERLGHQAGDRLLAELAIRLRGALRSRDSTSGDIAGRLGGDEFALLLHAGTVEEARDAVERVLRLVSQPFMVVAQGEPIVVTASIGVTVYPLDGSDADTLLRHADHAMYGAKQAGRNGHLFFDMEHSRRTEERVVAIGRVQEALDEDELTLYYQPKVDLRRGVVLGFEALLRWNHPDRGVVSPVHFLPLIEHTGLSARIGDHVLASALDQLDAWHAQGLDLSVSVNITARHLQEPDFVLRLTELLARHPRRLGPHLELEMLETAALTDIGFTSSLLQQCARLGVRWALDDFGTGYSTLTYLKRLPVQVLKIDRSFVQNMLTDAQDKAIVEGVISLARTFDCVAVAEGVETAAQARMLLDIGCDIGQGEGIAAPMPADQVGPWVRNWRGLFALAPAPAVAQTGRGAMPEGPG